MSKFVDDECDASNCEEDSAVDDLRQSDVDFIGSGEEDADDRSDASTFDPSRPPRSPSPEMVLPARFREPARRRRKRKPQAEGGVKRTRFKRLRKVLVVESPETSEDEQVEEKEKKFEFPDSQLAVVSEVESEVEVEEKFVAPRHVHEAEVIDDVQAGEGSGWNPVPRDAERMERIQVNAADRLIQVHKARNVRRRLRRKGIVGVHFQDSAGLLVPAEPDPEDDDDEKSFMELIDMLRAEPQLWEANMNDIRQRQSIVDKAHEFSSNLQMSGWQPTNGRLVSLGILDVSVISDADEHDFTKLTEVDCSDLLVFDDRMMAAIGILDAVISEMPFAHAISQGLADADRPGSLTLVELQDFVDQTERQLGLGHMASTILLGQLQTTNTVICLRKGILSFLRGFELRLRDLNPDEDEDVMVLLETLRSLPLYVSLTKSSDQSRRVRRHRLNIARDISKGIRKEYESRFGNVEGEEKGKGKNNDSEYREMLDQFIGIIRDHALVRDEARFYAPIISERYQTLNGDQMTHERVKLSISMMELARRHDHSHLTDTSLPPDLLLARQRGQAGSPYHSGGTTLVGDVEELVDAIGQDLGADGQSVFRKSSSLRRQLVGTLKTLRDRDLSTMEVDRCRRAFRDGVLHTEITKGSDTVPVAVPPIVRSSEDDVFGGGTRQKRPVNVYSTCLNGANNIKGVDESAIPKFAMLWRSQIRSRFVRLYAYGHTGKLLFRVGEHDALETIFIILGIAQSGKSTVGNVVKSFYPSHLVAVLGNMEPVFGLMSCIGKELAICFEMTKDMRFSRGEMQCAASGEDISVAVKHSAPVKIKWTVPLFFIGNVLLPCEDTSGSSARRFFTVQFSTRIRKTKTNLAEQLKQEMACIITVCFLAYVTILQRHMDTGIWDKKLVPEYYRYVQRRLARVTNPLVSKLDSDRIFKLADGYPPMSIDEIKNCLLDNERNADQKHRKLTEEQLSSHNIKAAALSLSLNVNDETSQVSGITPVRLYNETAGAAALEWLGIPQNMDIDIEGYVPVWRKKLGVPSEVMELAASLAKIRISKVAPDVFSKVSAEFSGNVGPAGGAGGGGGDFNRDDDGDDKEDTDRHSEFRPIHIPDGLLDIEDRDGVSVVMKRLMHPKYTAKPNILKDHIRKFGSTHKMVTLFRCQENMDTDNYTDEYMDSPQTIKSAIKISSGWTDIIDRLVIQEKRNIIPQWKLSDEHQDKSLCEERIVMFQNQPILVAQ